MSDLVLLERSGDVALLTFNDPGRRNAMTRAMGELFAGCIAELTEDASLRAVILTGAGGSFSAGGDLGMIQSSADQGSAQPGQARRAIRDAMRSFYKLFLGVRDLPCPSIAALNGHAMGAGLCVALACDVRIAAVDAKLGLNFTRLGLQPGMGATWTLPRLVGTARAAELLFSSRTLSGSEAAAIGLVNHAVQRAEVLPTARELAASFAGCAPRAVRAVKRALERTLGASLEDQLSFEAEEQAACFETWDVQEGIAAVRERRAPRFEGR
jgi:enoyl-CoA hydratase